jgi:tellurite methyltransferase
MTASPLLDRFGHIDIYLFDQLLRGRIRPGMRVLDAGCGTGRNLVYLLREGFAVWATDRDALAVAEVRSLAASLGHPLADDRLAVAPVERLPFADASFDAVLSSAVLHFARDDAHFDAMVDEMWRVLAPGGLLFARLASSIGLAPPATPLGDGRFRLPDGSDRYLVDEARLMAATTRLGATLLDPLKTTVVQGQRCMTTWVIGRPARA